MELTALKNECIEIATCFYQEKVNDGLARLEPALEKILKIPAFGGLVNPLLEAIQNGDYVLAADIFYHEMAMKLE